MESNKIATSELRVFNHRSFSARVIDEDGDPVADMRIECISSSLPSSLSRQQVTSESDGSFRFSVPPGRSRVTVRNRRHDDSVTTEISDSIDITPYRRQIGQVTLQLNRD